MRNEVRKMPAGRPRIEFDKQLFENLCHIQCTEIEIAATMNMSVDTLERRVFEVYERNFADVFQEKREGGKSSLRRAQWKKATEGAGDTVMQIFLGKNILNQADKQELKVEADGNTVNSISDLVSKAQKLVDEIRK